MTPINIFVTGATGYIGGSVLSALLYHPRLDDFNITALVRSKEKESLFRPLRVTPVLGSYDDSDLLRHHASQADVVIACADANHLKGAQAILDGLRDRHRDTGTTPVLIHTSGIGVFVDDAGGSYISDVIYSDLDIHQYESHSRRPVDVAIADAGEEGYVKTCIIFPGLAFSIAKTLLAALGIQNTRTPQMEAIVNAGIERRQGGVIGKGMNTWSLLHIEDLVCLYMEIFEAAINSSHIDVGRTGIYFAENGECMVGEIFYEVAKELSARGYGTSFPTVFTQSELDKYKFTHLMGGNARCKAGRSRLVGWKPVHPAREILQTIRDEVTASLKEREASLD